MNWFELQALRLALARIKSHLGVNGMKMIGSLTVTLGGLIAIFSGLEQLLAHFSAGDLLAQSCTAAEAAAWSGQCPSTLIKCLGQIGAGLGVFSPGLNFLKASTFSRPTNGGGA